uniref:Uncharacterized protein n=1 Tax=Cyclopterus lumpus TaxID=8103 RepID=A0A8C2ZKJ8_CYCLU
HAYISILLLTFEDYIIMLTTNTGLQHFDLHRVTAYFECLLNRQIHRIEFGLGLDESYQLRTC